MDKIFGKRITKKFRSDIMGAIRSSETKLEKNFKLELDRMRLRYKSNVITLPGKPDIVFKNNKFVIFIDSCFWHGCEIHGRIPVTNRNFWKKKISRNIERDLEVTKEYKLMGWKVMRIWEHDMKTKRELILKKVLIKLQ